MSEVLRIDIETRSKASIKDGVYRYVDDPSFKVLIFAWAYGDGPVEAVATDDDIVALLPDKVLQDLTDPGVIKKAYNAQFERVALSKMLGRGWDNMLDPEQWRCTMVYANELGISGSLDRVTKYLGSEEEKDAAGKGLIRFFSIPEPKSGEFRKPADYPEKWQAYIEYCKQDVEAERGLDHRLARVKVAESEWRVYALDQRINDRGAAIDLELAQGAVDIMERHQERTLEDMRKWTGLENANSLQQLKGWLDEQGYPMEGVTKKAVKAALKDPDAPDLVKKVLGGRLAASNTSTTKYQKMLQIVCRDGRARGMLQFYGATRTGRYAGRLVQVQNLPRNKMDDLDDARELVKQGDLDLLELVYEDPSDVVKQLVRTAFAAKPGHRLFVSDFSAIEARVIAWYAGEEWRLDVFRNGGDIYKNSASAMFNLPVEEIDGDMRQKGKVAELACGYQGGPGAMKQMGGSEMGLSEAEMKGIVDRWREASPNVVQFWYDLDRAAIAAVRDGGVHRVAKGLKLYKKHGFLFIELPSGRRLSYAKPRIVKNKFGRDSVQYEGSGTRAGMMKLDTYGGKLAENIVQATARDILNEGMLRLEEAGFPIIFHVHDEAVAEVPNDSELTLEQMNEVLGQRVDWAPGLPLGAEGYVTDYYIKD